jgi:ribonuclease HII
MPLHSYFSPTPCHEAGVDEAGRGCLAGPVFAGAVIFKRRIGRQLRLELDDSKKLTACRRYELRAVIEREALCWAIGMADQHEVDALNILNASYLAMHRAIAQLQPQPVLLLIDGNRFRPFQGIAHQCIIRGDALYLSVAAASVLAKTYRDDYMLARHLEYPHYHWDTNKGYPTALHRQAIATHGMSPHHRRSFNCLEQQLELELE